jgi:hypothetical protein
MKTVAKVGAHPPARGSLATSRGRLLGVALVVHRRCFTFERQSSHRGIALMAWIFALSKFELVLFIVSVATMIICLLLLLEIAGIELVDLL